jgi:hypothetical protein
MTTRQRVAVVLLWSVLVFVGTMFGASAGFMPLLCQGRYASLGRVEAT